ncbi:MAG: hypothetical protein GXP19_08540 [Gammaproteobacteria bacterium]|nr:hypothetical protein [Gammaproteobacteria bacterium]
MDKSIKKKYLFYVLMGIAFSLFFQSAVGQTNTRYGLGWNVAQLWINDPNGLGESGFTARRDLTYFSGMMTIPIDNHNPLLRVWYELKYRTFTLAPTTIKIGQEVKSLSLSVTRPNGLVCAGYRPLLGRGGPWNER